MTDRLWPGLRRLAQKGRKRWGDEGVFFGTAEAVPGREIFLVSVFFAIVSAVTPLKSGSLAALRDDNF